MKNVHHIGIAVLEMEKYIRIFEALGGKLTHRGVASAFGAECAFIKFGNIYIELVKGTTGPLNHINRFIEKYGVGIHHIALEGEGDIPGALPGMLVNFNRPSDANRILIETVKEDGKYKTFRRPNISNIS